MRKKRTKYLLAVAGIVVGWGLNALAWSVLLTGQMNTLCLVAGVGLMMGGGVWLLLLLLHD